jgi:Tfp pilus assembly protein PilZ
VKIDRGSPLFISRYMHMRNEEDMVKVIEFDPLHDSQDFRRQVMQALRKCAELERKGKRFYVKRTDYYQLRVNNGPAQLVNVSNGGIGVKLEKGFALGTEVQVLIQTTDEVLNRRLQYRNLNKVSGEVRWSKQQGSMYITGIQLKSLKADNTEFLLQAILDADRASA